ncbi:Hypothetical protein PHPALM_3064 [Phytophthora palmivora]|uniref:Myb/SANT-like DNA-binding domain-containing protein n=1 Tax=Phytophthora palmivora TaxID=4796 RepID=A0A2P4YNA7_9STRA|nr:Hypothetical protein PHPALM_3064 [Phytophthora palmivora]
MSLFSAPIEEGLAFDTGPESVYAVQDYALAMNKSVRVERASGADRRLVCTSEAPCSFFVQIYRQRMSDKKTYGKWYIASLDLTHSEDCNSVRRLTTRQIAELPAFMEAVQVNPKASIESLVALMLERHGVTLEKQVRLVYRARDFVRSGKTVARNIVLSSDSPLPPRQFVSRPSREKKVSPEIKKEKNSDRLSWSDDLIEALLVERLVKYGKEFAEAKNQQQRRELWERIHESFNAKPGVKVSVTQLRAKFRYLQEQYMKVRTGEEEFSRDPIKVVIYPRCWDMLGEYFGEDMAQCNPNVDVDHYDGVVTEANDSQAVNEPSQVISQLPAQPTPPFTQPLPSVLLQTSPTQPASIPVYSTLAQTVPPTQAPEVRQESSTHSDVSPKRRRLNSPEGCSNASSIPVLSDGTGDVAEKLKAIQSTQSEMARSMDGIKQVVEQSNEAIRGLQEALSQSNQVNAALLDFLKRQPSA